MSPTSYRLIYGYIYIYTYGRKQKHPITYTIWDLYSIPAYPTIQMDSSEKVPHILMVNHHVLHQNCHQWVNHYPCNVWWLKCHDCSQHPRYLGRLRKLEDKMTKLPCMWLSLYPELVEANLILIGLSAIYPVSPRFFPTYIYIWAGTPTPPPQPDGSPPLWQGRGGFLSSQAMMYVVFIVHIMHMYR